jgi:hypothetical protein
MTASMLIPGDGACVRAAANCNEYAAQRPWLWTLAFGQHEDRTPTHS